MRNIRRFTGFMLSLWAMFIIGCSQSSSPISTGFSNSEGGYSINLGASARSVPYGGKLAITAVIKDAKGEVVQFSGFPVTLTAEMGGEITPLQATIASGIVTGIYVAPKSLLTGTAAIRGEVTTTVPPITTLPTAAPVATELPTVDTITASFMGASSKLRITLFKP